MTSLPGLTYAIDNREQQPYDIPDAVHTTIPAGDYSAVGFVSTFAVERKSLADLVGSLTQGRDRFMRCVERLAQLEHAAIVVEASMGDVLAHSYRSKASPQSIIGSSLAIIADHGVPVVWAGDRDTGQRVTLWLIRRWFTAHAEQVAA